MQTTDANCLGCCRCPQCGHEAYWSPREKMHYCADTFCKHQFQEHDNTQFEQDDDTDGDTTY